MVRPTAKSATKAKEKTPKQIADSARNRAYHVANRERNLKRFRKWHAERSPAERLEASWRKQARPPVPKPGSKRAEVFRNVALGRAYCDWSDVEEVVRVFTAAAVMTELTGEEYVVDHSVPLISPFVCGLHTHTNLAVIPARLNRVKSNWIWPEMWPISWESLEILEKAC